MGLIKGLNTALAVAALGYGAAAVGLYAFQDRLIYFPDPEVTATPAALGLAYDSVIFTAADGVTLHGWYLPADPKQPTVLFCHGNAGNIGNRLVFIDHWRRRGLGVLLFDYRGYGQSQGRPSEAGLYRDAAAAWRFLTRDKRVAPGDIVVYGRSLGGAVAAHLAGHVPKTPKALVLDSSFTSLAAVATRLYPWLPVERLLRHRYPTAEHLQKVEAPVLILHSRDDELIPMAMGEALYSLAPQPKALVALRGSHDGVVRDSTEALFDGLAAFLADLAPGD